MNLQDTLLVSVLITAVDGASTALAKIGTSLAALGPLGAGATIAAVAVAGIGAASIGAAEQFQQNMAKIAALTDTSASQLQWYEQQILQLAPQLDVAPTQLAQGLYFVISAGEQGATAIDTLKYSAEAAAAGMTDFSTVADAVDGRCIVASVMNRYAAV